MKALSLSTTYRVVNWRGHLTDLATILTGLAFLFSGLAKSASTTNSTLLFHSLGLSLPVASGAVIAIIVFEIGLGFALLTGRRALLSLGVAASFLAVATVVLLAAVLTGYNGDCGCFGGFFRATAMDAARRNGMALILLSVVLFVGPSTDGFKGAEK